jgi:hypothetical protein
LADVAGIGSSDGDADIGFFPQLPDMPAESPYVWPPIRVIDWMKQEAKILKDRSKIIELEWPRWPNLQLSLNLFAPINNMPELNTELLSVQKDFFWKGRLLPLLEARLYNRDFDKANEIYFDISSRPVFEYETRHAFDLAKSHKYTFPKIYEQTNKAHEAEIESLVSDSIADNRIVFKPKNNRLKELCYDGYLNLLVIDPYKNTTKDEITSILSQAKLPEYAIAFNDVMEPSQPVAMELTEREWLSDNIFIFTPLWFETPAFRPEQPRAPP